MSSPHPFDDAAAEITRWLDEESSYYADALKGGHVAPFAAEVTENQKLDYYGRKLFAQNEDGTPNFEQPNEAEREALMKRVGPQEYSRTIAALMGQKPRRTPPPTGGGY